MAIKCHLVLPFFKLYKGGLGLHGAEAVFPTNRGAHREYFDSEYEA